MMNRRLIPALPDELGLQVLTDLSPPSTPRRWHFQPSRRDFDPSRPDVSTFWTQTYLDRHAVWTSAGVVCKAWRAELRGLWGGEAVVGEWPTVKKSALLQSFGSAQGIQSLAIRCAPPTVSKVPLPKAKGSFLDVPFHYAWRHVERLSLSPLPALTSLTFLAPPDLAGLFPLLHASPHLKHLCLISSDLDAPGRRYTQGLPILASSSSSSGGSGSEKDAVPYALESFEMVVDGGSVPYSAELSALLGPHTTSTLKNLSVSFRDVQGTFWAKIRLQHALVELLHRHATTLEYLHVDDWDQKCDMGFLHCPEEVPELLEVRKLVLGSVGLDEEGLEAIKAPKLEVLEIDDLRRTFEHDVVETLDGVLGRTREGGREGLKRVYLAGDVLDAQRKEVDAWARKRQVTVEWGEPLSPTTKVAPTEAVEGQQ